MTPHEQLLARLENKQALIGIIGLGYQGLPLVLRYSEAGYRVLGFDVNAEKVAQLNAGESYIRHLDHGAVKAARAAGFEATTDYGRAGEPDALIICVPTPLDHHREPDLHFVTSTIDSLVPHLRTGQLVALESPTYPGTCEEELKPRMEKTGLTVGKDIFLVYSPERMDPGNPFLHPRSIPKVCGGYTDVCLAAGVALYGDVFEQIVPVHGTSLAEFTTMLENIHRAVNVALANEMKIVADRMGLDIYDAIAAAATKPFGFVPYYPGPGMGGHSIPIDPFYLSWKAREYGIHAKLTETAGLINSAMPEWVANKVIAALNSQRKAVCGSRILVLGVAYKKDTSELRNSASLAIMDQLRKLGAELAYSDPYRPELPHILGHEFDLTSVELTPANIAGYDCVLVATDHSDFDYELIREHAQLIVDSRGVYRNPAGKIFRG